MITKFRCKSISFCIYVIGLCFSTHFRVARREAAALYFKKICIKDF